MAVGDIYHELKEKFGEGGKRIKVDYGLDETVNLGPVISAEAKKKILRYIEIGEKEGAKLLLDGCNIKVEGYPNGYSIGPTIFDEVTPEMTIAKEEIFGPVGSIIRVNNMDEAIEFIHSSPFGNAASIYTQSVPVAREFLYRVQCGNIWYQYWYCGSNGLLSFRWI